VVRSFSRVIQNLEENDLDPRDFFSSCIYRIGFSSFDFVLVLGFWWFRRNAPFVIYATLQVCLSFLFTIEIRSWRWLIIRGEKNEHAEKEDEKEARADESTIFLEKIFLQTGFFLSCRRRREFLKISGSMFFKIETYWTRFSSVFWVRMRPNELVIYIFREFRPSYFESAEDQPPGRRIKYRVAGRKIRRWCTFFGLFFPPFPVLTTLMCFFSRSSLQIHRANI